MKRVVITVIALIFSISFCMAQLGRELEAQKDREKREQQAAEEQRRRAEEQKRLEAQRQKEAEEQRLRELELLYQNTIASAERNFTQRQYTQAKQDYITALELKPENAASINPKIDEIDRIILDEEKKSAEAERERQYQEAIASAERNFSRQQYEQAKQDYRTALAIKPENAAYVNSKIAEIDKPAQLYIYRKRKQLDILPKRYEIFLDNAVVGNSTNSWKTTTTVSTFGTKTLSATIEGKKAEVSINFEPGGVYYVRSDVSSKSVKTGKINSYKAKDGTTKTYEETKLEYTPILQSVDRSVGASEYRDIVVR